MVLANAIGPTILPFLAPLTMGLAVFGPLTILVAVIEWRFFRYAGIRRHAFYHAVLANILSSLAGIAMIVFGQDIALILLISWFSALPVSIVIEGVYLYMVYVAVRDNGTDPEQGKAIPVSHFRWRWVVAGNFLSYAMLIAVTLAAGIIRGELSWQYRQWLQSLESEINVINGIICIGMLAWLVLWPLICAPRSPSTDSTVPSDKPIDRVARPLSSLRD